MHGSGSGSGFLTSGVVILTEADELEETLALALALALALDFAVDEVCVTCGLFEPV